MCAVFWEIFDWKLWIPVRVWGFLAFCFCLLLPSCLDWELSKKEVGECYFVLKALFANVFKGSNCVLGFLLVQIANSSVILLHSAESVFHITVIKGIIFIFNQSNCSDLLCKRLFYFLTSNNKRLCIVLVQDNVVYLS